MSGLAGNNMGGRFFLCLLGDLFLRGGIKNITSCCVKEKSSETNVALVVCFGGGDLFDYSQKYLNISC